MTLMPFPLLIIPAALLGRDRPKSGSKRFNALARLLEKIQKPVLIVLENIELIEQTLQLVGLGAVFAGLREEAFDAGFVLSRKARLGLGHGERFLFLLAFVAFPGLLGLFGHGLFQLGEDLLQLVFHRLGLFRELLEI